MSVLACESLRKVYDGRAVVDDVSFAVQPGEVVGFLGPNGAGKTTTLRLLLGLAAADAGRAAVLGRPYAQLPMPGLHVGAVLDDDGLHPGRTGRAQLRIAARVLRRGEDDVERVLDLVDLRGAASDRVRTYSLGMRRRLALAAALLGEPQVLVLDEPANGLDPAGMRWLRGLLRRYAADGGGVLISSHVLNEVAQTVDRVVVLHEGRVRAAAPVAELSGDRSLEDAFLALTASQAPPGRRPPRPGSSPPAAATGARDATQPASPPARDERKVEDALRELACAARQTLAEDAARRRRPAGEARGPALVAVAGEAGAGRTTVSLLLADALATSRAARVAVVDADTAGGTLGEVVGAVEPGLPALAQRAAEVPDAARAGAYARRIDSGVDVFGFAAGERPATLEAEHYAAVLDLLCHHYEVVVCDLPAAPGDPVAALVRARADRVVVVASAPSHSRDAASAERGDVVTVINRLRAGSQAAPGLPDDPVLGASIVARRYRYAAAGQPTRAAAERLAATVLPQDGAAAPHAAEPREARS